MLIRNRVAAGLAAAITTGGLLAGTAIPAHAAAPAPAAHAVAAARMPGMHLDAGLHGGGGYRSARGHAGYESYWRRHLDVSVWNARRLAGRTVVVYVHGTRVGTMRIWRGGSGHFERSRGVPRCSAGTIISIRTRSGALVASGTFHRHWIMR